MPKPEEKQDQDTFNAVVEAIDALESDPDRHLSIQIDTCLRDAVRAAQASGKPAAVTMTIKVKPEHERRVGFSAVVNAKLPRPPVAGVTLFADADGRLHTSDPRQRPLEFPKPLPFTHPKEK